MTGGGLFLFVLTATVLGGVLKGLAGFGFGIIATSLLLLSMPSQQAITILILPVLAANLQLLYAADTASIRSCGRRFGWYILATVVGTLAGMQILAAVPDTAISMAVGGFAVVYVAVKQDRVSFHVSGWLRDVCYTRRPVSQLGIGAIAGGVFGATNNGLPTISYLDHLDIDHETFTGLVGLTVLAATVARLVQAVRLDLLTVTGPLSLMLFATLATVTGVMVGTGLRHRVSSGTVQELVLLLIAVVGLKLLVPGL